MPCSVRTDTHDPNHFCKTCARTNLLLEVLGFLILVRVPARGYLINFDAFNYQRKDVTSLYLLFLQAGLQFTALFPAGSLSFRLSRRVCPESNEQSFCPFGGHLKSFLSLRLSFLSGI